MFRKLLCLLALPLLLASTTARSDEVAELRARNAQLEATVEELTLQLAEAIRERKELEQALAAAKAAPAEALPAPGTSPAPLTPVAAAVSTGSSDADQLQESEIFATQNSAAAQAGAALAGDGCDVADALAGYEGSGEDNRALSAWLQSADRLASCSTEQLRQIRKAVSWDFFGYQKEVLALIDRELSRR